MKYNYDVIKSPWRSQRRLVVSECCFPSSPAGGGSAREVLQERDAGQLIAAVEEREMSVKILRRMESVFTVTLTFYCLFTVGKKYIIIVFHY